MTKTFENDDLRRVAPGFRALLIGGASALAIAVTPAVAQDTAPDTVDTIEEADDADDDDKVVVTGSRLRRDTFSSIAPLQVITADDSLDVGIVDAATILQRSTAASGAQIDATFQGFVLDNGPGSETLNLRGLGADRTLLLINGRRFAPAGVEGAPSQPSINLLPASLIERYDLLLDGASSVYGSDAVAGVGNIVLRKDFEGLELFAAGDYNVAGAGHDYTLSAAWGKNTDRGFIGFGAEYDYTDEVTFGDRTFLSGCDSHYEITEDGNIRQVDVRTAYETERDTQGLISAKQDICKDPANGGAGGFSNRLFEQDPNLFFGSAYSTPGNGNIIPNYSDTGLFGVPIDQDQDGIADIYFPDFTTGDTDADQSLFAEQKRISVMGYGEYTFEGEMNITPFFEVLYTRNEFDANSGVGGLSAVVPANNPFNVCNPNAPGGIDCGLAQDELLTSPEFIAAFQSYYNGGGGSSNCFGLPEFLCVPATFGLLGGALGPTTINPQVSINGHLNLTEVTLEQTRGVAGFRADLPFLNRGSFSDWQFETSLTYSYAEGESDRFGIREDRLALSLGYDPTIDLNLNGLADDVDLGANSRYLGDPNVLLPGGACDTANVQNPNLLTSEVSAGCVPVNLFAPSLYTDQAFGFIGDFASQAERDYLFDNRSFNTVYEQAIFNAFLSGQLFELPAGGVNGVIGVEYRIDEIDSQPNDIAAQGLFPGFFRDRGAVGEKWTREAFAEIGVPLIVNKPLIEELTVDASVRFTEDEFAGSATTYSVKGAWRPFTSLLVKSTYGTSFKAPNLREQFFLGQSGFTGFADPCAPPESAVILQGDGTFAYTPADTGMDPSLTNLNASDDRDPDVLNACIREGRNPFTVGVLTPNGQVLNASAEVFTVGTDNLGNEKSDSYSLGFSFEQPWFEKFDLNFGMTYYDIEIEDAIVELSSGVIVGSCFSTEDNGRSPFCDLLGYDASTGLINEVNTTFINRDKESAMGIDYNLVFSTDFTAFDQPMEFGLDLRANQLKERQITLLDADTGDIVVSDDLTGEFNFPEWQGFATASLDVGDYRFLWETRYFGEVEDDFFDPFSDAEGTGGVLADTCLGPNQGDVLCRDVNFADEYFVHTAGVRYRGDTWTVRAGIRNVFDTEPPRVDGSTASSTVISNTPLGAGYDLNGREYYFSVRKDFQ